MSKLIMLFLFLVKLCYAELDPYENFQKYMNSPDGRKLSLDVFISHSENNFKSEGTLHYLGDKHYLFYSEGVGISFKNGVLKTINNDTKQIIYDNVFGGNLSILDILCGTQDGINIDEVILERNNYKIEFSVEEWDMAGTLWLANSGEPKKLMVGASDDSQIVVNISPFNGSLKENVIFTDTSSYEVIDLRE